MMKKLSIVLMLTFLLVGCNIANDVVNTAPSENPPVETSTPEPTMREMTLEETREMQDIFMGVLADSNYLTPDVHKRFWEILDILHGSSEDVEKVKDMMAGPALIYMKYVYEDAILSLDRGTPYKSKEREDYENRLKDLGVMTDFRITENDKFMEHIAHKEPIQKGEESGVVDEEMIKGALASVDVAQETVEKLFTRP